MSTDGSALRIFADFPVLLDMCVHNARAIDGSRLDKDPTSPVASTTQGLTRMVREPVSSMLLVP